MSRAKKRASKRARRSKNSGSALDHRALPSPAPGKPPRPDPPPGQGGLAGPGGQGGFSRVDWSRVEELASRGLSYPEIEVAMNWPGPPPPALRDRMEEVMRRGRIKGFSQLKLRHYQSALDGSVMACRDMIGLLDPEEDDDEGVEVEEVILDAEEDGDPLEVGEARPPEPED